MFSTKHNECVGFESRWRVKKVSSVQESQTTEVVTNETGTAISETKDVEIQTEASQSSETVNFDEEKLADWLKKIYPAVKKELDDSANSRAFRGYKLVNDGADTNCKLVQSVSTTGNTGTRISALCWNSTNQTLAASFSYKHSSWCYHQGIVFIYTLNTEDLFHKSPKFKLNTESCVKSISFHQNLPTILAAGLFSGDILIWNIERDEQIVVKVEGHEMAVSQINWINEINSKNILLASAGLDGHLLLWNFNLNQSLLSVKEKFQIRPQLFAKDEVGTKKITRSVVCFDFSKFFPEFFIVGAEGGLVVQCSIFSGDTAVRYYQPHKGEINSIGFSPNRKDMFLSCGTDQEIRIYMLDQEEPAQVVFLKQGLNSVIWIPYEERLICGVGKTGLIEIFKLVEGKAIENSTKEKIKTEVLTQIAINQTKSNIVVVGTENGTLQLWRVPWTLFGNMCIN